MTGQERESQLSAMFDGELPAEECELLARRLSRDEQMRRSYAHYALIGSVIRNEPLASGTFADKVHGVLRASRSAGAVMVPESQNPESQNPEAQEPTLATVAGRLRSAGARWAAPLGGVGLAASVAAVALLSLDPSLIGGGQPSVGVAEQGASGEQSAVVEEIITSRDEALVAEVIIPDRPTSLEPESYVTPPVEGLAERRLAPAIQLANYVVAHGTVSAPMMRHSALSAFITDQDGIAQTGVAPGNPDRQASEQSQASLPARANVNGAPTQ